MHSLSSNNSRSRATRFLSSAPSRLGRLARVSSLVALVGGASACSDGDDADTVALADSGSITSLIQGELGIPTTVAVRDGVAWVAESQFNNYPPFAGAAAGVPGPFRLIGIPLNGTAPQQIALPDNFFPEGVTSKGGYLFVGSVADGSIVQVAENSTTAQPFLPADALEGSVIGLTVSNDGTMLWACNTDPAASPPTGAVVGITPVDFQVQVRHELPAAGAAGAFCNDLVMSPDGALWITESFGGRLFRIESDDLMIANSADVWLQAPKLAGLNGPEAGAFGVNGLTLAADRLFVVNSASGALFSIDPGLETPTDDDLLRVRLTEGDNDTAIALAGADGITTISDTRLLIVENGFNVQGGKRVVRADLGTR
jgi:sugar lactone lactonase YvrE